MKRCLICGDGAVAPMIDFGPQALCNRFLSHADEPQEFFHMSLGQCDACGLIQLLDPPPALALKPRFDWITYNEQEGHLDNLVERVCRLPGVAKSAVVGAVSFKDDTTVARFQKRGFDHSWRLDPKDDLEISDSNAGLETIQEQLSEQRAEAVAAKRGLADILVVRHILEHAQQPPKFAAALKRLVRPGGYLVFEVPDCQPALERKDYSMPWEEHVAYFTPRTFLQSLSTLGFLKTDYECYVYSNENSLVAIVQERQEHRPSETAGNDVERQQTLGRDYAAAFHSYRDDVRRILGDCRKTTGRIAMFGAGHLSCFWMNVLGVSEKIDFVVDDHPAKTGLFMPGSRLPIYPSSRLLEHNIRLCLLSLSPESEAKVVAKNEAFVQRGGSFASMFPGKANSLGAGAGSGKEG
jgi:hypothetical protein